MEDHSCQWPSGRLNAYVKFLDDQDPRMTPNSKPSFSLVTGMVKVTGMPAAARA
jgi:hypothetical protein